MAETKLADASASCVPTSNDALLDEHRKLLVETSAIAPDVIAARGYKSETVPKDLGPLGFKLEQWRTPCLVIPVWNVTGTVAYHQIRPDDPRTRDGKLVKYDLPAKVRMVIDVPPAVRTMINDPAVPLYITEGVRKADAAVSRGLCCIGLLGVWNWRGKNDRGGKTVLADWESVALNGRRVYLVFDSDAATKPDVQKALDRLQSFLQRRGALVEIIGLPHGDGGGKMGLDDYFAAGHTVEELKALPVLELTLLNGEANAQLAVPWCYANTAAGLVVKKVHDGHDTQVSLTNFPVRITAEVQVTDGVDDRRVFEIEAVVGGVTKRISLFADEFERMAWVVPRLGAAAVLYAGHGLKDHARAAIQLVSRDIQEITAYGHTGWVQHEGQWVYLHAGGAVGADPGADADQHAGGKRRRDAQGLVQPVRRDGRHASADVRP